MTHSLRLQSDPFKKIKDGTKTIEVRLFDEKRSLINIGDEIIFSNTQNENETIRVAVLGLLRYQTFSDLLDDFDLSSFGADDREDFLHKLSEFYPIEKQRHYSVVGIRIKLVQD